MSAYKISQAKALEICRTALREIAHNSRSTLRGIAQDALHVTAEIKPGAFCGDCGKRQVVGLIHTCSSEHVNGVVKMGELLECQLNCHIECAKCSCNVVCVVKGLAL